MTDNPYKRLRELTRTSQKDFAAKYGFSKTVMSHIESGQFPDLSDDMVTSLGQECHERGVDAKQLLKDEYNSLSLQDAYHNWQSIERLKIAHRFQAIPFDGRSTEKLSPFHFVIADIAATRQSFCKLLKVPAASVMRYERGDTRTMPKIIESALREVHYPHLDDLKAAQEAWL
jgi:transcriptional regulator with XRE-family HTH domain